VKGVVVLALAALLVSGLFIMAQGSMAGGSCLQREQYRTGRVMYGTQGSSRHSADLLYVKDQPDDKWQGRVKANVACITDDAVIASAGLFYDPVAGQVQSERGEARRAFRSDRTRSRPDSRSCGSQACGV